MALASFSCPTCSLFPFAWSFVFQRIVLFNLLVVHLFPLAFPLLYPTLRAFFAGRISVFFLFFFPPPPHAEGFRVFVQNLSRSLIQHLSFLFPDFQQLVLFMFGEVLFGPVLPFSPPPLLKRHDSSRYLPFFASFPFSSSSCVGFIFSPKVPQES